LRVVCSAGTYIRVLAEDIGRATGVGAHLTELRRTRAGRFDLSQSVDLEKVTESDLMPIEMAVEHLAAFEVAEDRVARTLSGLSTRIGPNAFTDGEAVRMLSPDARLLAVGVYEDAENSLRPKVVLG
ncbi:MAG: tRNA pseudouridine(55) synthase TruB, partial [Pyrinomonadaceae bacterium]